MFFDTPVYLVFLLLVTGLYWKLSLRRQNLFLLAASYFFYGCWDWRFLLLMAGSTGVDYFLARRIEDSTSTASKRACLVVSLVLNFAFLGFFKYFNFFIDSFSNVSSWFGYSGRPFPLLSIVLPAGISFYTFQAVAYIVDVYLGRLKASRSIIDYALFISLFPHLVAGPIQRPSHLLPQIQTPRGWNSVAVFDGCMLILMGLFRKCVIADNCALLANAVFGGAFGEWNLATVLLGTYAFAWQIYGDFSGYSDIARGSAQLLGFHFMVNFRQPYLAESLGDFWRRWHVSLSTWLRDYLYIPLGGNRLSHWKTYRNLMLTMILGGLWHGANATFVVWGGLHGVLLAGERWWSQKVNSSSGGSLMHRWGGRLVVFHLVCLAWIFFRATNLTEAIGIVAAVGRIGTHPQMLTAWLFLMAFTLPLFLCDLRQSRCNEEYPFQNLTTVEVTRSYQRRVVFGLSLLSAVLLVGSVKSNAFIYFQF